jgi:uncharacterized membrane protein YphA (DoxX/SURF4 family)
MTMVEMAQSTALMTRPTAVPEASETPARLEGRSSRPPGAAVVDHAVELNQRFAPTLLRLALAGLVLAVGVLPRLTLLVLAGHLAGTFLTFLTASELMWGTNFLELTADGEFVVKNIVFISAALVLIGTYSRRAQEHATA